MAYAARYDSAAEERASRDGRSLGPQHVSARAARTARVVDRLRRDQPPSGPTRTVGAVERRGLAADVGQGRPGQRGHRGEGRPAASTLGQPGPPALHGRLAGHPCQPLDVAGRLAASHRTTDRSATKGTMRSTPSSVSFCTTSSGRSPFTSAKATVERRLGCGVDHDLTVRRRARPRPPAGTSRHRPRRRRPSPAHPGGGAAPGRGGGGRRRRGPGPSRSATNTWAGRSPA